MNQRYLSLCLPLIIKLFTILYLVPVTFCATNSQNTGSNGKRICSTKACQETANRIWNGMDVNVDPCDDFYQFACGNWLRKAVIPKDRSWWSVWALSRLTLKKQLKRLLDTKYNPKIHRSPVIGRLLDFYSDCMDTARRDEVGIGPLYEILDSIDGWPVIVKSWDRQKYNWFENYVKLKSQLGANYLIKVYIDVDLMNNTQRAIYLDPPELDISIHEFESRTFSKAYKRYMRDIIELMRRDKLSKSRIDADVDDLYKFEYQLQSLITNGLQQKDQLNPYRRMTIASLSKEFRGINWRRLMINMFRWSNTEFSESDIFIIENQGYFKQLGSILRNTPERTIANFLGWRFVIAFGDYTVSQFRQFRFKFQRARKGLKSPEKDWEFCYNQLDNYYHFAMGRLYIDNYFNSTNIRKVETLVRYIKDALREAFNKQTWMDPLTRKKAKRKLNNMASVVAYQPWIKDNQQLEKFYEEQTVIPGNFIRTILKFEKIDASKKVRALRYRVNRYAVRLSGPAIVNAFNYIDLNYIQFPAAILGPPFFSSDVPDALNFGGIGKTIGHEIIHSFDDEGKQHDKDGNLRNWWSPGSTRRYNERAQCFIDQYDQMKDPETGLNINGVNTQGENIADNGGIDIAFNGYKKFVSRSAKARDERLPGPMSSFTPDQLFFISFASIWCEKERPASLRNSILQGVHSPSKFRVVGTLMNNDNFAQVFSCPKGSPMNPESKCKLW
ncbi:neprilysin-4-like [Tetranychus urticae]|uniref:Peptidase M13 N-terminal domain-containing protein n=1 Tax=Tetranychus urticae TaxID=32264 RepID=T1KAM0_TETUR|nr:neprilysin-4-like [Tetranychus urticae]XP_025016717.1 neprilysin-4-like [Tetranychus urticae]